MVIFPKGGITQSHAMNCAKVVGVEGDRLLAIMERFTVAVEGVVQDGAAVPCFGKVGLVVDDFGEEGFGLAYFTVIDQDLGTAELLQSIDSFLHKPDLPKFLCGEITDFWIFAFEVFEKVIDGWLIHRSLPNAVRIERQGEERVGEGEFE